MPGCSSCLFGGKTQNRETGQEWLLPPAPHVGARRRRARPCSCGLEGRRPEAVLLCVSQAPRSLRLSTSKPEFTAGQSVGESISGSKPVSPRLETGFELKPPTQLE